MTRHLFVCSELSELSQLSAPSFNSQETLDSAPEHARLQLQTLVNEVDPSAVLVFWDPSLGEIPLPLLDDFEQSPDDVWHSGKLYPPGASVDLLRYADPTNLYHAAILDDVPYGVNFRINLRAAFIRARIIQVLGGLDTGFATLEGAALEMGWRWLERGAVCRQVAGMVETAPTNLTVPPLSDQYRLIALHTGRNIRRVQLLWRLFSGVNPLSEWRASRQSSRSAFPAIPVGAADRDLSTAALPAAPQVSVILPTYGRYRYVAEVLEDLRQQTIKPTQILIADGNPDGTRKPEVYQNFADLPLEILWLEPSQNGTCASRNACLARLTGEYVWFVDDDSRLDAQNLENHLRLLITYGADVSVGPAYTHNRPDLHGFQREIRCTFMDCGTTLCRTSVLEKSGGFDLQYNESLPGEDRDIGDRFTIAGGLMLNNPYAKRFHYLAPVGGARSSSNNVHRWRRWALSPRPVQSVYYRARRYFDSGLATSAILRAWVLAGRPRTNQSLPLSVKLSLALSEFLALPVSLLRLWRSFRVAKRMLEQGPQIPPVKRRLSND